MRELPINARERLTALARVLVDQNAARMLVSPYEKREGFWFGAGNLSRDRSGAMFLIGRYRNYGDSRTGLDAGTRGSELAVFRSDDQAKGFRKIVSFSKSDLSCEGHNVVSIEGAKLLFSEEGVEVFVSTEKAGIEYPPEVRSFHKPGTGVWTIDHATAPSVEALKAAELKTIIRSEDPRWLHAKDPVVSRTSKGDTLLYFCTHPFNWASANSALSVRPSGGAVFSEPNYQPFPRGFTWDVAISRITGFCPVPAAGLFKEYPGTMLVFYDGGESMRKYDEHPAAVRRPRGYSCEELGGLAYATDGDYRNMERLSTRLPFFVSPYGTGCSRYVDVLAAEEGYYVTWQRSQPDGSQPLVLNFVRRKDAEKILA